MTTNADTAPTIKKTMELVGGLMTSMPSNEIGVGVAGIGVVSVEIVP